MNIIDSSNRIVGSVESTVVAIERVHILYFDLNSNNGITPNNQVIRTRDLARVVDNPIREGYTFSGWNTEADGSVDYSGILIKQQC
ncbi:InlB B-repeat-containing protein [endosymbiont 'TC1' of Trimyema compressum]|uniref:InlB B-repeat-containing protein n=1 Tax=endosymbiont 'TC1' of Trimyema compressum TaxID=243899 RepID=UPI001392206D|nr:InlB B-repeat-containing protein [endosymbiont 'TC1' of Trimyema compressum]